MARPRLPLCPPRLARESGEADGETGVLRSAFISIQYLSKGAVKLKIKWTQFYCRLSNGDSHTTTPSSRS
jgi:hypothetical protein